MLEVINQDVWSFNSASERLYNDKELIFEAIKKCKLSYTLHLANDEIRNDREVVSKVVEYNGFELGYVSKELRNDKEIVLKAVKNYGYALRDASEQLRNDKEVVL